MHTKHNVDRPDAGPQLNRPLYGQPARCPLFVQTQLIRPNHVNCTYPFHFDRTIVNQILQRRKRYHFQFLKYILDDFERDFWSILIIYIQPKFILHECE